MLAIAETFKDDIFYNVLFIHGAELDEAKKVDMLVRAIVTACDEEGLEADEEIPMDDFVGGLLRLSDGVCAPLEELEIKFARTSKDYPYFKHRGRLIDECTDDVQRLLDIYETVINVVGTAMKAFDTSGNEVAAEIMQGIGDIVAGEIETLQARIEELEEAKEENDETVADLAEGQKEIQPDDAKASTIECYDYLLAGNEFKRIFIYGFMRADTRKELLVEELLTDVEDLDTALAQLTAYQAHLLHEDGVSGREMYNATDPAKEWVTPQRADKAYAERLQRLSSLLEIYEALADAAQAAHRALADDKERAPVMAAAAGALHDLCAGTIRKHGAVEALRADNIKKNGTFMQTFTASKAPDVRPGG